ncbi:EpsI family protein [Candidatus Magnetomoraceae bacterium gMMP-15]
MSLKRTLVASCIMLLTMVVLNYLSHAERIQPNKPFSTFPSQIGKWHGTVEHFDEQIYDKLGVDDSYLAEYKALDGRQVNLYIGFYQSQREGDLIHSPKNCMPGGGWNIIETGLEELNLPDYNRMKLIKLILQKGPHKQIVFYWFQSRGRIIASEYMQKIYLVIDSIIKQRTDGSFVRLIAPVINNDAAAALSSLKEFTKILMPLLYEYIPS